jgi:site-specific DNA-methyltransferase (adenine-specific)
VKPYYEQDGIVIYHGDCREVLPTIQPELVDLVLTDPPYPMEFDSVWDSLADCVPPVMKPKSFLVTLLGHYQLPRVMTALCRTLDYFWLGMMPNNNQPIMHGFGVKVCAKPVLIYRKGKAMPRRIFFDNFILRTSTRSWITAQALHKWGQAEAAMYEPIDSMTEVGGLVLDPFLGGGTTLVAAKLMGRNAIGIDIEERCCEIAANRLAQGVLDFTAK